MKHGLMSFLFFSFQFASSAAPADWHDDPVPASTPIGSQVPLLSETQGFHSFVVSWDCDGLIISLFLTS